MPVTFPKGEEPSVLSENPNGPKGEKQNDERKPEAKDFLSKGPVQANAEDYPPSRSKEELQAEAEKLNRK